MLISQFYPLIGGAEKQAGLQSIELASSGYSVIILTGKHHKSFKVKDQFNGIPLYRYRYLRLPFLRGVSSLIAVFFNLMYLRNKYYIIHVHQMLFPAYISCLIGKIFHKRVIVKIGSSGSTSDLIYIYKIDFI